MEAKKRKIDRGSNEWWYELDNLADLVKFWASNREDNQISVRVVESMQKLGLVIPQEP